jgi:hypothetical protein
LFEVCKPSPASISTPQDDHTIFQLRGERKINEAEAVVVRRIFREFAVGNSPRAIATDLKPDGIPDPFGHTWGDIPGRGDLFAASL